MPLADIFKDDVLGITIRKLVKQYKPKTVIEIGSSDGSGSTSIFADSIDDDCRMFCIEAVKSRFDELLKRTAVYDNVHCYSVSSVGIDGVVDKDYIRQFVREHPNFNVSKHYPIKLVLSWFDETIAIVRSMATSEGIAMIKNVNGIETFDMAFIDGSPFTGMAELDEVYGSKIIIMDDTIDIKCYDPMMRLINDENYELLIRNDKYRNGFAVFKLK